LAVAAAGGCLFAAGRTILRGLRRFDFRDRTVLITGGSRGLGLVLARQFAQEGARVILCARDTEELERAAADLVERGADVWTHDCDVTDRAQVQGMVERVLDECGALDVVVNNAGIIQAGPMETMTPQDYEEAIRTHLYGPMHVIDAALPHMRRRGAGRVVNISSIGGLISVPHLLPYCSSKFALVGYSMGLRSELARDGIVVTTVCPGLMRTGSPRNAYFKGQHRAEYAWFKAASSLPFGSMSGERAARKIVDACRYGDGLVVLGVPFQLAALAAAVGPNLASDVLAGIHRLLPGAGGIGRERALGSESESAWSQTWLTEATDRAAVRNNEI